ncbi:hypothetical protein BC567DRAFT_228699, partial [Phyllosticta citribraziliensis]
MPCPCHAHAMPMPCAGVGVSRPPARTPVPASVFPQLFPTALVRPYMCNIGKRSDRATRVKEGGKRRRAQLACVVWMGGWTPTCCACYTTV